MKTKSSLLILFMMVVAILVTFSAMTGCNDSSDDGITGSGGGSLPSLSGTWAGTWTDTRYNVSGNLSATFAVNGSTVNATGTIDLSSLGLGNETGTGTGTIAGDTLTFNFSAATVGTGRGTVIGKDASGTGNVTGVLNFGAFTFSGTATDNVISGIFDFTSPSGGNGVARLTRQ